MKMDYEKGELAKEILLAIAGTALLVGLVAMPGLTHVIKLFRSGDKSDAYRARRAINSLKNKKFIRIYKKDGVDVLEVTKSGKRKLLQYKLDDMKLVVPSKWDGYWRIVMFDISESKRRSRDAVSQKMRELGLFPIQKSVFVSPYICKNEIDFIGEFFDVRDNIIYIKAKEIEGVRRLKEHFNIL